MSEAPASIQVARVIAMLQGAAGLVLVCVALVLVLMAAGNAANGWMIVLDVLLIAPLALGMPGVLLLAAAMVGRGERWARLIIYAIETTAVIFSGLVAVTYGAVLLALLSLVICLTVIVCLSLSEAEAAFAGESGEHRLVGHAARPAPGSPWAPPAPRFDPVATFEPAAVSPRVEAAEADARRAEAALSAMRADVEARLEGERHLIAAAEARAERLAEENRRLRERAESSGAVSTELSRAVRAAEARARALDEELAALRRAAADTAAKAGDAARTTARTGARRRRPSSDGDPAPRRTAERAKRSQ